jgi:triphosphatase
MVAADQSARPASEVELKLEFSPADLGSLVAHAALQACLVPPEERDLVSTYFDTPDRTLHKAGVYLRLRESGGRVVQTIKAAKSSAELLERYEWERELTGRSPDLGAAKGTPLEKLLTPEVRASLQPAFETRVARRIHRIARDGSEIEAAIDRGEIATATHSCPVCELELELKRGEVKELFRLARILGEDVPLRLEVKTKAERGYELLAGRRLMEERATPIKIAPGTPAGEAFRAIALSCVRQIVANEPAMCAGKAEALHQMRIGLRRLRGAIVLFAGIVGDDKLKMLKAELKWITRELGPARELDVFAADVLGPLREAQTEAARLAAAHDAFEEKRAAAYRKAAAAIQSGRFRAAILDVVEWVETRAWTEAAEHVAARAQDVAQHATVELAKLRRKIKRKGAELRHLSVAQRHRLRINAKHLRYATEFFAATFPGEGRAKRRIDSLSALKDLQDALGGLNDLATHHALIAGHTEERTRDGEYTISIAHLAPAQVEEEALMRKAEQAYVRFAGSKAFWKG